MRLNNRKRGEEKIIKAAIQKKKRYTTKSIFAFLPVNSISKRQPDSPYPYLLLHIIIHISF